MEVIILLRLKDLVWIMNISTVSKKDAKQNKTKKHLAEYFRIGMNISSSAANI